MNTWIYEGGGFSPTEVETKNYLAVLDSGLRILDPVQFSEAEKAALPRVEVRRGQAIGDAVAFLLQGDSSVLRKMWREDTDFWPLTGPNFSTVLFTDSSFMEYLLKNDDLTHRFSPPLEAIREHVGANAVTIARRGNDPMDVDSAFMHRKLRKLLAPDFTPKGPEKHYNMYAEIIQRHASQIFAYMARQSQTARAWGREAKVDMSHLTARYTLGAVFESLFGYSDIDATLKQMKHDLTEQGKTSFSDFGDLKQFIRLANKWVSAINNTGGSLLAKKLYPGTHARYLEGKEKLKNYTDWMLEHARMTHSNGEQTMIGKLLEAHLIDTDNEQLNMRNRKIRESAVPGLSIVGFETTALILQRFMFQLRSTPGLLEQIQSAVEVNDEQFLENVFFELSRLHPGIPRLPRVLNQDMILEKNGNRFLLPKETMLTFLIHAANKDPRFWGTEFDPEKFHPERWNAFRRDGVGSLSFPPFFFSFGAGNTQCTGPQFALLEFKTFVKEMVQYGDQFSIDVTGSDEAHFDWVISEHVQPKITARLSRKKKRKIKL